MNKNENIVVLLTRLIGQDGGGEKVVKVCGEYVHGTADHLRFERVIEPNLEGSWAAVPLPPCEDCGGELVWAEAGLVPGARACAKCGSTYSVETRRGTTVRVLHYRVGREVELRHVFDDLDSKQKLVGGNLELVRGLHEDDTGLDLWINEEGLLLDLPHNRTVVLRGYKPRHPNPIVGDFFIARTDDEGNTVSLSDADVELMSRRIP